MANPHGAGVAWVQDGKVRWRKGLNWTMIHSMIKEGVLLFPYVIHFRLATVGARNAELCHPFPLTENSPTDVEGEAESVLFHNGHWSDWTTGQRTLSLAGHVSDSRVLAAWYSRIGAEAGEDYLERLSSSNRFAVLTKDGPVLYGRWIRHDNVDYSNLYFLDQVIRTIRPILCPPLKVI